jgi:hypothetical protein
MKFINLKILNYFQLYLNNFIKLKYNIRLNLKMIIGTKLENQEKE